MNEETLYFIIQSALWSVVGLLVGVMVGRLVSDIHDIKRHLGLRNGDNDDTS